MRMRSQVSSLSAFVRPYRLLESCESRTLLQGNINYEEQLPCLDHPHSTADINEINSLLEDIQIQLQKLHSKSEVPTIKTKIHPAISFIEEAYPYLIKITEHPDWRNGVLVNEKNILRHILRLGHFDSNIVVIDGLANALIDSPAQAIKLSYIYPKIEQINQEISQTDQNTPKYLYHKKELEKLHFNRQLSEGYLLEDLISLFVQTTRILTSPTHNSPSLLNIPSWPTYFHLNQIAPTSLHNILADYLDSYWNTYIGLCTNFVLLGLFGTAFYQDLENLYNVYQLKQQAYDKYSELYNENTSLAENFLTLSKSLSLARPILQLMNSGVKFLGINALFVASLTNAGWLPKTISNIQIQQTGMYAFSTSFVLGSSMALLNYYTDGYWQPEPTTTKAIITRLLKDLGTGTSHTADFLKNFNEEIFTNTVLKTLTNHPNDSYSQKFLQEMLYL